MLFRGALSLRKWEPTMDRQSFEEALKRDGYDEIATNTTLGAKHNPEESHTYDVRGMVVDGALTVGWNGQVRAFGPGEAFEMARGCPHAESYGAEGAVTLFGRRR